jgi:hypothetical protein
VARRVADLLRLPVGVVLRHPAAAVLRLLLTAAALLRQGAVFARDPLGVRTRRKGPSCRFRCHRSSCEAVVTTPVYPWSRSSTPVGSSGPMPRRAKPSVRLPTQGPRRQHGRHARNPVVLLLPVEMVPLHSAAAAQSAAQPVRRIPRRQHQSSPLAS